MLNYIFGTSVKVGPMTSEISGLNFKSFDHDIVTQYGTTTPGKYMFRRVNSSKFVTDNFFLLELEFLIQQMLQSKNIWSRRRDVYDLQVKLRTETWIKQTHNLEFVDPDWAKVKKMCNIFPYPTQQEFLKQYKTIKRAYNLKGLLLDALPGSGKTPTSLIWGLLNGNSKHIIICPLSTVDDAWMKHLKGKVFKTDPVVWVARDGAPVNPNADYFIFHNEAVRNDTFFKHVSDIFNASKNRGVDLTIDECHNFNDLNSKQTQNLIAACDKFPFNDTLPMSGTPLKNSGREAFTIFACIDKLFVGPVRERFNKSYGLSRDKLNTLLARRIGRIKYTIEALQGMQHKEPDLEIKSISFPGAEAYTLKAVALRVREFIQGRVVFYERELPRMTDFFYSVIDDYEKSLQDNMSALSRLMKYKQIVMKFRTHGYSSFTDIEDSKFAKEVEVDIEARLKGQDLRDFRNIKSAVKYVGLKIRGEALGLVLTRARMNAIKDTIAHADLPKLINDAEKKTLIFTSYVDALEECEQQLLDAGFKPITIYGLNNNVRDASLKAFREDPNVNPAITTFDSLREGVDATAANLEIFLNAPWRDYEMQQAKARIYRQGQDTPVRFILLDLDTGNEANITSRSIDIMEWSKEQTEILLGRLSVDNPAMRTIMGNESFDIIDEDPTDQLTPRNSSPLSLF